MSSTTIATARDGVELRSLGPEDAPAVVELLRREGAHLTRLGDFVDEVATGIDALAARYADSDLGFGIRERGALVGTVTLIAVDPPRYGLGFWLAEDATGRGLATLAVDSVVGHASTLGATDVFAGVTHGNTRSVAVLERCGFTEIERFATYTRFHRSIAA